MKDKNYAKPFSTTGIRTRWLGKRRLFVENTNAGLLGDNFLFPQNFVESYEKVKN
jgi:hypothetical protein